ncbi:MAG: hypothetical protein IKN21_02765 [Prevotella sp.]|nr:hypothetical protein [Prevotella sp.]MBR7086267.1 hypothetical protein [Prevotella sp.]
MRANEQTQQQTERFIRKVIQKFPAGDDNALLTDIHVRVSQDSGEMLAFDDEEQEITRCVVDQWIENKDEDFFDRVTELLREELKRASEQVDAMGIMKPFSFVLEDDDRETIAELYLADDDTVIIGGELMEDLDQDLDAFFEELIKE